MLNNASVWAHIFFVKPGQPHDPDQPRYDPSAVSYRAQQLNVYKPRPKINTRKNLITGEYVDERVSKELQAAEASGSLVASDAAQRDLMLAELALLPVEWVSFWKPALSLRLVADWTAYPRGGIPQPIAEYLRIERTPKQSMDSITVVGHHPSAAKVVPSFCSHFYFTSRDAGLLPANLH